MSDAEPTTAELLVLVNVAIRKLLCRTVTTYTVQGVTYTLADIAKLQAFRTELMREGNQAAGGGGVRLVSIGE